MNHRAFLPAIALALTITACGTATPEVVGQAQGGATLTALRTRPPPPTQQSLAFRTYTVTVLRDGQAAETVSATGVRSSRGTGVLELAQSIRADRPEAASGELGYHVLDVMVAITEAAASGTWVEVASTVVPAAVLPESWDPRTATL